MIAILFVLSLLVFGAGLIAWAVHMHGVWASEANRVARRQATAGPTPSSRQGSAPGVAADNPPSTIDESACSTEDAVLKEARP